jgi:hypothetical protein
VSTVLEIERAIEALPPEQFDELAAWFAEKREQAVDAAFEEAILAGKFDAMADRAIRDAEAGKCRPLDEILDRS